MASPQIENGHIDLATELIEFMAGYRISGEEWQVLLVIWRKTYGWHKKEDAIALSQFNLLSKMAKPHINRALKKLLSKKVIVIAKNGNTLSPNTYSFNKHYDEWVLLPKKVKAIKTIAQKDNRPLPKKVHTKEKVTNTKDNNVIDIFLYWNNKKIVTHRELTPAISGKISAKLRLFTPDEIRHSFDNYSHVIECPEKYWLDHHWTLMEFLDRSLEKFVDDQVCEQNYRRKEKSKNGQRPTNHRISYQDIAADRTKEIMEAANDTRQG
jgi:phage replication O-like protein O